MLNKISAEKMARENILPFWQGMMDKEKGGFYGEADFYGKIDKEAKKGSVLNSRILWTFSAAYKLFGDENYKSCAAHAKDFLTASFYDKKNGGIYWLVDHEGKPVDTRKQFYSLAFAVYALSEHFLAAGEKSSLDLAMNIFNDIEKYGYDPREGGYIEACQCGWQKIEDLRLSDKDMNCPKSMNTNLHVMEAYTTLLNASKDSKVKKALDSIVRITLNKIVNQNYNFNLFFDMSWVSQIKSVSYGHDIEGSWLLYEAALALDSKKIIDEVKNTAIEIAEITYKTAIDKKNGGLLSGSKPDGKLFDKKEWWPQAEAVIGFYNAYQLSNNKKFYDAACSNWSFIENYFLDKKNGDWHNETDMDNKPDVKLPKAGFWKCPYHNARMCFEIFKRIGE